MTEYVLGIDPGFKGTGWAVVRKLDGRKPVVEASGVIRPERSLRRKGLAVPYLLLALNIQYKLSLEVHRFQPTKIVIEMPALWGRNAISLASAQRGDLFQLAMLVGVFSGDLHQCCGVVPVLRTAAEWKGQLSKEAIVKRIQRALGVSTALRDHEADAVGMCLNELDLL